MIRIHFFSAYGINLIWVYVFFLFSLILFKPEIYAQQYPHTIWIPLTFYDFRSDYSNPEFEADHNGGLEINMVQDTLDKERKPVLGSSPFFNYYIHKWFRPWKSGDFKIPDYQDNEGVEVEFVTVDYDTAFKNIVIEDSLPFEHIGNGIYQFEKSGYNRNPQFFWIDELGFGNEGRNHNYSFTMELHSEFTYQKDLDFEFLGDDDVWAFINGKLAMDIGGIHEALDGEIDLEQIAGDFGLQEGKKYKFDFFYAERHTSSSRIKITTNLFTPYANLRLYPDQGTPDQPQNMPFGSGDTIKAGETIKIYGHAFDSVGWRQDWDKLISIQLIDPQNNVKLISNDDGTITILPEKAHNTIIIEATFINPDDLAAVPIKTNIEFVIGPGDAIMDSAFTRDADGNGYLDRIEIFTSENVVVTDGMEEMFDIEFRGTVFSAESVQTINGGRGLLLFLKENITNELQTDWQPSINVSGIKGLKAAFDMKCKDGTGPVADKARYYPGSLQNSEKSIPDSIMVTVSELVNWPISPNPNQIFRYTKEGRVVTNAFMSMDVIDDSTVVLIVSGNLIVETLKDSIQLLAESGVVDKGLNRPHTDGRKAFVEWGVMSFQFIASNNPFIPGVTVIAPEVRNRFDPVIKNQIQMSGGAGIRGTIVRLEVRGRPLKAMTGIPKIDSAYGTVKVYDVVGNIVRNDLWVIKISGNDYGIYWDGYNKRGRAVGRGTYLFSVSIIDVENNKNNTQFKIGVTR